MISGMWLRTFEHVTVETKVSQVDTNIRHITIYLPRSFKQMRTMSLWLPGEKQGNQIPRTFLSILFEIFSLLTTTPCRSMSCRVPTITLLMPENEVRRSSLWLLWVVNYLAGLCFKPLFLTQALHGHLDLCWLGHAVRTYQFVSCRTTWKTRILVAAW